MPVLYLEKGSCPEIDDTLPTSTRIWLYDESDPTQILPIDYTINIIYIEMQKLAEKYHLKPVFKVGLRFLAPHLKREEISECLLESELYKLLSDSLEI